MTMLTAEKISEKFNKNSEFLKRGISLTPVKFGISFNASFLNQAGALLHIYNDGSVYLNHGGTRNGPRVKYQNCPDSSR